MARILYADDDANLRGHFERALPRMGHEVVVVDDAVHAWALLDSGEKFDCIISDWEMPQMDGLSFMRMVRGDARTKDVPFALISGRDKFDDGRPLKDVCAKAGAMFFDKARLSIRDNLGPFFESLGLAKSV